MSFTERAGPLAMSESDRPPALRYTADGWTFRKAEEDELLAAECFISASFRRPYGAHLGSFYPDIMVLRHGGELVAACGLRHAQAGRIFLERYLDGPIEAVLSGAIGECVERPSIVEVGNLAVIAAGNARDLIGRLTCHLQQGGTAWAVFSAVPALRNSFRRLGIPLVQLAPAARERLAPAERAEWGTYYDNAPVVTAVRVSAAQAALTRLSCTR